MNADRWRKVDPMLQHALELHPDERMVFLDRACSHDASLREELQRLIQSYESAGSFLEHPVEPSLQRCQPGTAIGPYVVEELLGVGGMGEVYRATDTRLGRTIALKMVRDELAHTPGFRDRLEREARAIASLNHPHICALHDIGEHEATTYLVMEYVSGELLSNILKLRRLECGKALQYAREIADALAAMHARGILHRDLKPGNVMITASGVKVLDFGLAKFETTETAPNSDSAQGTSHPGLILGTAAYMSPEQARGQAADKRSDIWAFGCVLYEMLTGKRAFSGSDTTEILAAILKNEPDWTVLPGDVAPPIRRLLRACLEKDAARRMPDIAAVSFLMEELNSEDDHAKRSSWLRFAVPLVLFVAGFGSAAAVSWWRTGAPETRTARLNVNATGVAALTINQIGRDIAISPDGTRIVYVGNNGTQLFTRFLDQLEPVPLGPPEQPAQPFFSPDGRWVGFFEGSGTLRRIAITGGPVTSITEEAAAIGGPRGATWGPDGTIIFADSLKMQGLQRVSTDSRERTVITRPNAQAGELDHVWPEFLPSGNAVLFTITSTSGQLGDAQIAVLDLRTGEYKTLFRSGSHAHYVETGHLVYGVSGTLRAIRFDIDTLKTIGSPVPVLSQVVTTEEGAADFDIARNGTLAYVTGGVQAIARVLVWVDRQGHEEPLGTQPRAYLYPRLSKDGSKIALDVRDQDQDIWIWDIRRKSLTKVTSGPAIERFPIWMPDGRLIFTSDAGGSPNLYSVLADGTGAPERLTEKSANQFAHSVTRDGKWLVFSESTSTIRRSLMMLAFDNPQHPQSLVETPSVEQNGALSPDEHWLAYESNETGEFEIYVRPFPNVGGMKSKISTNSGRQPLWRRDGRELFYSDNSGALMSVDIHPGREWSAGDPTQILEPRNGLRGNDSAAQLYDISLDGRRFLMVKRVDDPHGDTTPMSLVVVQNWFDELKRIMAQK